jgi:hypothetical protein
VRTRPGLRVSRSQAIQVASSLGSRLLPNSEGAVRAWCRRRVVPVATYRLAYRCTALHAQPFIFMDDPTELEPLRLHHFIQEHLVHQVPLEETTQYNQMRDAIAGKSQGYTWGCHTLEDVERYFVELLSLAETVRNVGLMSQRDVGNVGDEICGAILSNGQIAVGANGRHRVALAQHYHVAEIPLIVLNISATWLNAFPGPTMRSAVKRAVAACRAT